MQSFDAVLLQSDQKGRNIFERELIATIPVHIN